MKVGELFAILGLDMKDFEHGLDNAETQADRAAKNIQESFRRAAVGMKKIGQTMSLAITAPLTLIGGKMIDMAMDAVESENLFEVSMGNMAKDARAWSISLSKSLGLNQYELRKNVGMFNAMLNSMGLGEQASYGMSKGLVQLAYDMASFYNLKPEEAFEKLRSGITGEAEPLKQLGIVVLEEQTKMAAYQHGIAKMGAELTESQKVLARYYAIMDQTSKAQGDLARTLDSPANKARIARAKYEELSVTLGIKLLPIFEKMIGVASKGVDIFFKLPGSAQTAVLAMLALAWAIGPLLIGLSFLIATAPMALLNLKKFAELTKITVVVDGLAAAFRALNLAMLRNPIVLGIIVIAGALLVLARSSKTVSDWLDNVIARLRALAGLDTQLPAPNAEDPAAAAKSYNDYAAAMAGAGDAAGGAAKDLKKFLAAFDEVYQAQEDEGSGGAGAIPPIPPPPGGGSGGDGTTGTDGVGGQIPTVPQYIPPIQWGGITPPPTAVVTEFQVAVNRIIAAYELLKAAFRVTPAPVIVPAPDISPVQQGQQQVATGWQYVQLIYDGVVADLKAQWLVGVQVWNDGMATVSGFLTGAFAPVWQLAQLIYDGVVADFKTQWLVGVQVWQSGVNMVKGFQQSLSQGWVAAQTIYDGVIADFKTQWQVAVQGYRDGKKLVEGYLQSLTGAWLSIQFAYDSVIEDLKVQWQAAVQVWSQGVNSVKSFLANLENRFNEFKANVQNAVNNALTYIKQLWENHKTTILLVVAGIILGIVAWWLEIPAMVLGAVAPLIPKLTGFFQQIPGLFQKIMNKLPEIASKVIDDIIDNFSHLGGRIASAVGSALQSAGAKIAGFMTGGGKVAVPAFATGGIVTSETIARVGEAGPEAIIPLDQLSTILGGNRSGGDIHLHVGVLVADKSGLKELERRLRDLRISEDMRLGVTT